MGVLVWDQTAERYYETGVSKGVLYPADNGTYPMGYAWNGLTGVTESPSGAEATPVYANNQKYLNLISVEEFGGTIEALTYPDAFGECDGTASPTAGINVGQQTRKSFGLSYQTILGNDVDGNDLGYKIHLIYGATAAPSEKAYATVSESPEAMTLSWTFTTIPAAVTGLKPTSIITIDSTKVDADSLAVLEDALYGTVGTDPRLPLPTEVLQMFEGTVTLVTPTAPTFVAATGVITIPSVTGVKYYRGDTDAVVPAGTVTIGVAGASLMIYALPTNGTYAFTPGTDDDWMFTRDA